MQAKKHGLLRFKALLALRQDQVSQTESLTVDLDLVACYTAATAILQLPMYLRFNSSLRFLLVNQSVPVN